nr:MAG TPA: hypothetical protein [Caudoviricetes sp.]
MKSLKRDKNKAPEGCAHPDCFACRLPDCTWNGRLGYDPVRQQAQLGRKSKKA